MANDWKCFVDECKEPHTEESGYCDSHLDEHMDSLREMEESE